jgi:hypothetical protein
MVQMSRDEALKKVDMLQKEWARQHRLVEKYDRGQVQQLGKYWRTSSRGWWLETRGNSLYSLTSPGLPSPGEEPPEHPV